MPSDLDQPVIKFSEAAKLIGITPKTLRHWLQRGQIDLTHGVERGRWNYFTVKDTIILSLVATAVRFGFRIEAAHELVRGALDEAAAEVTDDNDIRTNFLFLIDGKMLVLWHQDGEPRGKFTDGMDRVDLPSDECLVVDVHSKVMTVVYRGQNVVYDSRLRDELEKIDRVIQKSTRLLRDALKPLEQSYMMKQGVFDEMKRQRAELQKIEDKYGREYLIKNYGHLIPADIIKLERQGKLAAPGEKDDGGELAD